MFIRNVYSQIPPKVDYSLTERGLSLVIVLEQLCDWGNENRKEKQHESSQKNMSSGYHLQHCDSDGRPGPGKGFGQQQRSL